MERPRRGWLRRGARFAGALTLLALVIVALQLQLAPPVADLRQCPPPWNGTNGTVAFMHIPKTAGSYLSLILEKAMPESGQGRWCRRYGSDIDEQTYGGCTLGQATPLRQKQEFVANLSRIFPDQCSGFGTHYDFSLLSTLGVDFRRTLTLTVLRNPVDLVISLYYFYSLPYWREAGFYDCDHAGAMALFRSDDTVSEPGFAGLLRFASIPHLVANRQAYQLAGALECTPGGANPWSMSEAEALARAKHNLSRLCLVLIQEHMEESLQQLRGFMGWADGVVNTSIHENINPHPVVPPDVRQRLEQMNALDMELYRYAVRLFKQRSRAGSSRASRRAQ